MTFDGPNSKTPFLCPWFIVMSFLLEHYELTAHHATQRVEPDHADHISVWCSGGWVGSVTTPTLPDLKTALCLTGAMTSQLPSEW